MKNLVVVFVSTLVFLNSLLGVNGADDTVSILPVNNCPEYFCLQVFCENAVQQYDDNGCPTCKTCPSNPVDICPAYSCIQVYCENAVQGYDDNGCPTCLTCPTPPECPRRRCLKVACRRGYDTVTPVDGNGCPLCPTCVSVCPQYKCAAVTCEKGFAPVTPVDENGCSGCPQCKPSA